MAGTFLHDDDENHDKDDDDDDDNHDDDGDDDDEDDDSYSTFLLAIGAPIMISVNIHLLYLYRTSVVKASSMFLYCHLPSYQDVTSEMPLCALFFQGNKFVCDAVSNPQCVEIP